MDNILRRTRSRPSPKDWRRQAISPAGRSRPRFTSPSASRSRSGGRPGRLGKTELAKALGGLAGLKMIRMQCYEGLDEAKALYEWKYAKQLLYTQILKDKLGEVLGGADTLAAALTKLHDFGDVFFSKEFVEPRPLLQASNSPRAACCWSTRSTIGRRIRIAAARNPVGYQVSIPELGTVSALVKPTVILTSNGERDLSDALKRRCLHLHIASPSRSSRNASSKAASPASRMPCARRSSASSTRSACST